MMHEEIMKLESDFSQCLELSSVLQHYWLSDKQGIKAVKECANCPHSGLFGNK